MNMGHLYHDSYFSGMAIELAVKEKLKTREVNAREDRALLLTSQNFQRAKQICEKSQSFEKWKVGQALRRIRERTPGLDRSMAAEKARVEDLQKALLSRSCFQDGAAVSEHVHANRTPTELNARPVLLSMNARKSHWRKDKPLNTELGRVFLRRADYIRRSEHTVKALARLERRQDKRRLDHRKCKKELLAFSKPLIERAGVILKGRDDLDVDRFLVEFERFIIGADLLTTDPEEESEGCCGNGNKPQLDENSDEGSSRLLAESAEMSALAENPRSSQNSDKNLNSKPVRPGHSARDSISNTPDPALRGSAENQRRLPEVTLHLPPIKPKIEPIPEVVNSQQQTENAGSHDAAEPKVANSCDLAAVRDRGRNSDTGNKGHNWSLSMRGPVWLPQLWRQHKKRVFHSSTVPRIIRRRKIGPQRI